METKIYQVEDLNADMLDKADVYGDAAARQAVDAARAAVGRAAGILRGGGLVAFPTETVYGLGADAFNEAAVRKVYAAKGRPQDNPMIVHIARASDVGALTSALSPDMVKLIECFWPGSLTLIVKKRADVPAAVTGGLDTVAVRMPDDPVAAELIRQAGTPVAAPSANLSGKPSPTKAAHVIRDLGGRIDVILAGGECRVGIESTVLDLSGETPVILRPGAVTADQIADILGKEVETDPALLRRDVPDGLTGADAAAAPKAPGMKYRHYAPNAEMLVLEGRRDRVKNEILRLKALNEKLGRRVGTMLFEEKSFTEAAHGFFSELRDLDDAGTDLILAGALSENDGLGFAVMNRMMKAAGYNIIKV
ncbi:MAG: threonylcarbamoyl-AMP synthase [Clostridiales Family XIII bacterium]|jgi:L-threonylcarbamoyladenylate synthase|nr:threonylcarbamoyl-AMP synthase [Clostridiales Family XIII bacterium]